MLFQLYLALFRSLPKNYYDHRWEEGKTTLKIESLNVLKIEVSVILQVELNLCRDRIAVWPKIKD